MLRGRGYGHAPDPGLLPGQDYATLIGGLLDGLLLDVRGWRPEDLVTGVALMRELGQFGPGGRALCGPRPGEPWAAGPGVWGRFYWSSDTP
ncbi:hypothetical protein ACWDZ4_28380 [Streptomyces sp. NPDC003016]